MSDHQKERFNQLMGRYLTGDLDEKSSKELTSLLNESPVRRKEYDLAVKYYARLLSARFENRRETNYRTLSRQLGLSSSGRKFSMLRKIATIAAVAVLLLAMGLSVYLHTSSHTELQEKYTEIVVPSGSQSKLALADGTQVYLNAGSTLRYFSTLASTVRNVFLEGEAYFEVAANPEKPFIVHTSQLEVKVLGTEFNVKSYPEESNVEVSLLGGKVEVTAGATADKVQLMPDQLYVFNKENNTYEVQDMDVSRSVGWTTGKITFVNQSLPDILRDLERRKGVRIIIESEQLQHEHFSGSIQADYTLEETLNLLDVDRKYIWEKLGKTLTIRER